MTITYTNSLGGHVVRAQSITSAWNTLARKLRGARVIAREDGHSAIQINYAISVVRRDGAIVASGWAYVSL